MRAACGHSRWRELSPGTQLNSNQLDQCVTILRCFCLRLTSDDLKSVSSCSVSLAQRRHRSAKRFQTRLSSVCEASWAIIWHSVANFRNRSAACIWGSLCRISDNCTEPQMFQHWGTIVSARVGQWPTDETKPTD